MLSLLKACVQSLVRELRSHKPDVAKKKRIAEIPNQGQKAEASPSLQDSGTHGHCLALGHHPRPEKKGDGQAPSTFLLCLELSFLVI